MKSFFCFPVLLLFCFAPICECIKFIGQVPGHERFCFYEVMNTGQKYSLKLAPKNLPKYMISIQQSSSGSWNSIFQKQTKVAYEKISVDKLTSTSSTYSFCVKNQQPDTLRIEIQLRSGIELLDLEILPDKTDTENLQREISWIERSKNSLYETISKIEQTNSINSNSSALLSTKMILFAVIGLISVGVVNFLFFQEVKKTFKDRKLI